MKSIFGALALAVSFLAMPGATAAPTSIAKLPILNLDDTGAVKPNLMLLYDNSGSMASAFTPDYIDDSTTCRSRQSMAGGTRGCVSGHPPFNSPDFNRQYYDPKVLYLPPVNDLGVSYPSQTADNTTSWTNVSTDPFGVNTKDLLGGNASATNLVSGFPDLNWCDANGNCSANTATYTYPNNTIYTASSVLGTPYYYTIQVAEYCTNDNLTDCVTTAVGASAPAGYPKAAKVRWCNSTALTNCQAKYVGNFKYPRFSRPTGGTFAYGTILIGTSATTDAVSINSVSVTETGGPVIITNGSTAASSGTTTLADQARLAEALAASIIAKTGLTNKYTACVFKPAGTVVPACLSYGISLPTNNNMVAVIPISCVAGATSKSISQCAMLTDASRDGWALTVDAPVVAVPTTKGALATLVVSGTSATFSNRSGTATSLASLTLVKTNLLPNGVTFASNVNSSTAAAAIAAAINAARITNVTATTNCDGTTQSTVCIVTKVSYVAGQALAVGALNSANNMKLAATNTVAGIPPTNSIPTTRVALGAGASVFVRTDIVSTDDSYPKAAARSDCKGLTSCTYAEEMTNFANWYAYYKTRNQMMKTSVGLAFNSITASFNVGIVSLSTAAGEGAMTPPKPFSGTDRTNWYTKLYAMNGSNSTPLRPALNAIGKLYANLKPYVATSKAAEVVQFPCQQNYTFLTTDGYWNGGAATGVDGVAANGPLNNDNVESTARFCLMSTGCVDPADQDFNSLADVALYWYNGGSNGLGGSLRPTMEPATGGIVPGKPGENPRLHMNTYTLGLGVDGVMNYEDNYDVLAKPGGDFYNLTHGVTTGCSWNSNGAYVWPDPLTSDDDGGTAYQSRVDDLWHAAINGHGKYFSASNPTQVITGLRSALSNIIAHSGAAAAAATSTPNISLNDNDLFSNSFTTVQWSGELTDKKVDPITGAVGSEIIWSTSNSLGLRVTAESDTRKILMLDATTIGTAPAFKDFLFGNLSDVEKAWFKNKCTELAQCPALSEADRTIVNGGAAIVNWLRGQQLYANDLLLRAYGKKAVAGSAASVPLVLGDIASSKPAYVREPRKSYTNAGYSDFVIENAKRKPVVYVGANDGMLHAFDTSNGAELWAYMPRITMNKLYKQTSTTYGTNHQYTVDGSPEVGDVKIGTEWKTVLVAGLAGGGRGYFALDVTDPDNPAPLWETCADATICKGINNEPEMGLTFGNPQTGTWLDSTGTARWVVFVTSGYNNLPGTDGVAGGTGKGWLMILDIATGQVLKKIATTGSGDVTTPSGLARITGITSNPSYDPLITYVYGGDILGQMWRFDLTVAGAPSVSKMGDAGTSQPITARPDVTYCTYNKTVNNVVTPTNQVMVAFGTGRLLDVVDLSDKSMQSLYVIRDSSSGISATDWRSTAMAKQTLTTVAPANSAVYYTAAGTAPNLATQLGWYVDFNQNAGERVNLDPMIALGGITVVTNIPDTSTSCKVGGSSVLYTFDVCTGKVGSDGVAGTTIPGGAAAAGASIVSTANGLVAEVKLVNGLDVPIQIDKLKDPVSRRSGWRRIRN